jgi:hypothetical protein
LTLNSHFENTCSCAGSLGIKHDLNTELNNCNPESKFDGMMIDHNATIPRALHLEEVILKDKRCTPLIFKRIQEYLTKVH